MTPAEAAAAHILNTLPTRMYDAIGDALDHHAATMHECGQCGRLYSSPSAARNCCIWD